MSDADGVKVQRWSQPEAATETRIRDMLDREGLQPYQWNNAPRDVYAAHTHSFDKVIYVVRGSITFGLPDEGK